MLFRLFPFDPGSDPGEEGGALFVPRSSQGGGRHDNPDLYAALYLTREPTSAVAELLKRYIGRVLRPRHLRWGDGGSFAIASFDELPLRIDLDDPAELSSRGLRPSRVATGEREVTRGQARTIFEEGALGFSWWSSLEASWINATVFAERARQELRLVREPEPVTVESRAVREAAQAIGVGLA